MTRRQLSPDQIISASPEIMRLNGLFEAKPPLPVGVPDIRNVWLMIQDVEASAPGYAFNRLSGWMADVWDIQQRVEGPLLFVDGCCSLPEFRQRQEAAWFARCGVNARAIMRDELFHKDGIAKVKANVPELVPLIKSLARHDIARSLLEASIQESLFELTISEWEDADLLGQVLTEKLTNQKVHYIQDKSKYEGDIEGGWGVRFRERNAIFRYPQWLAWQKIPSEIAAAAGEILSEDYGWFQNLASDKRSKDGKTARRELAHDSEYQSLVRQAGARTLACLESGELASQLIQVQAAMVAQAVYRHPRIRPARFVSMDKLPPDQIAVSAMIHTPPETQRMNIFPHALISLKDPNRHVVGDICEPLQLPDNSIALFTIFDGWPFYEKLDATSLAEAQPFIEKTVQIIEGIYNKLMFGGQLVIFPWEIMDGGEVGTAVMNRIVVKLSSITRHGIGLHTFSHDTLRRWMSESDALVAAKKSAIFKSGRDSSEALIITKQRESLVNRIDKNDERQQQRAVGFYAMLCLARGLRGPTP